MKILGKANSLEGDIATGLAIEILDKYRKKISLNTKYALNEVITTPSYDLNFYLRYKSTQINIGSGDASSFTFFWIFIMNKIIGFLIIFLLLPRVVFSEQIKININANVMRA
ncbi:fimbrial protein [Providencia hangzhouensis]|uniref:fimbrial protein n=1 Tax=Providencia hangzhouensis TaxID=3031799 RepID=UPI0034DCC931